jgi:hypothetical protein
MAEIKFTIPNNQIQIITDAFSTEFGYQEIIDGQPNPQSKGDFTKERIKDYIKSIVKSNLVRVNSNSVISNADRDTNSIDIT